ncbi:phosphoserine phosphatase [Bradyrhizobium sp. LB1.3]
MRQRKPPSTVPPAGANGIAAITPERVIREGAAMEQLMAVLDEDPDIAMLVLAANPGAEGPGPLVALLAHALGTFPVPVTVISGALSDQSVDSLS